MTSDSPHEMGISPLWGRRQTISWWTEPAHSSTIRKTQNIMWSLVYTPEQYVTSPITRKWDWSHRQTFCMLEQLSHLYICDSFENNGNYRQTWKCGTPVASLVHPLPGLCCCPGNWEDKVWCRQGAGRGLLAELWLPSGTCTPLLWMGEFWISLATMNT